jgi:DNA-binding MurR/RpiR family transcriptional regulator
MTAIPVRPMPASATIPQRIARAYPAMSASLRQFADFVIAEPLKVARISIHQAEEETGVSVASANRFAKALGFEGYAEFRRELISGFESVLAPVERLRAQTSRKSTSAQIYAASLREDIDNLQAALSALDADACAEMVEAILAARSIFVVGFANAAHLAALLAVGIDQVRGSCTGSSNHNGTLGAAQQLFRYNAEDLVIAIAFPRYIRDTVEVARFAARHGVPVMAITDSPRSPLAAMARWQLYVPSKRQLGATSDTAALAAIEALRAAVMHRARKALEQAEAFAEYALPWFEAATPAVRKGGPR